MEGENLLSDHRQLCQKENFVCSFKRGIDKERLVDRPMGGFFTEQSGDMIEFGVQQAASRTYDAPNNIPFEREIGSWETIASWETVSDVKEKYDLEQENYYIGDARIEPLGSWKSTESSISESDAPEEFEKKSETFYPGEARNESLLERGRDSCESIESWITAVTTLPEMTTGRDNKHVHEFQEEDPNSHGLNLTGLISVNDKSDSSNSAKGALQSPHKMTLLLVPEDPSISEAAGRVLSFQNTKSCWELLPPWYGREVPAACSISPKGFRKATTHHAHRVNPAGVKTKIPDPVRGKNGSVKNVKMRDRRSNKPVTYQEMKEKEVAEVKVTQEFIKQFHAHAKHQDKRKTGAVITKMRSHRWLKNAGLLESVFKDSEINLTFSLAAGGAVVLNLQNYVRYLRWITLRREIEFEELLGRLSECSPLSPKQNNSERNQEDVSEPTCCAANLKL